MLRHGRRKGPVRSMGGRKCVKQTVFKVTTKGGGEWAVRPQYYESRYLLKMIFWLCCERMG